MEPLPSLYRRTLPESQIAFSSAEGRRLFAEALAAGTLEGFFPLIEQFHTQSDPSFCGLASLVMALNALGVDPGRVWRGSWRWFSEELLDCCTPLEHVKKGGVSLDEVACLARCNGTDSRVHRPPQSSLESLRESVLAATSSTSRVMIAAYCRRALGQTGAGHFSPLGGYHAGSDRVLILDVARFKYPPHWVPLATLYEAMQEEDSVTRRARGWLVLSKSADASLLAQLFACREGLAVSGVVRALLGEHTRRLDEARPTTLAAFVELGAAVVASSGIAEYVRLRPAETREHVALHDEVRLALESLPLYAAARSVVGEARALALTMWLAAAPASAWTALDADVRSELAALLDRAAWPARLAAEARLLSSQVEFLLEHARSLHAHGCAGQR